MEWDKIIKTMSEWNASTDARGKKAIYIACANYLSSNKLTSTWLCYLDWYGRLTISPGPHVWAVMKGELSICIHTINSPEGSNYIEAELLEYFNSEVKTVRLTLNNYHSELDTLIQYICRKMNLNSDGKLVLPNHELLK